MNDLTKLVLVGVLTFSATMVLTQNQIYGNDDRTSISERVTYSALAGGMAVVISPLLNYRTEERREETYQRF